MKKAKMLVPYFFLLPICALAVLPIYFVLTGAFIEGGELSNKLIALSSGGKGFVQWSFIPQYPTLHTIIELLLDNAEFYVMFWNTVFITAAQLTGQFIVGTMAAWSLSRMRFFGRRAVFILYTVLMLLPFSVTMVPSYLVLDKLHLLDTIWAVILPSIFSALPVFIMARGFDSVPRALLEAAELDGADKFGTFIRIGLPLCVPSIMAAMILSFIEAWSAIEPAMIFIKKESLWPLSLYLQSIPPQMAGKAMAASLITLMTAALVFLFGQKYLELGIQTSGIKE
ncbi:MAG: carbohydrate ABC transporter permease [Oscillospiraceae bacterium]